MVITLFVDSFALALAVSYFISKLFRESAEGFLSRFFAKHVSTAAAKYLQLVIVFVGVTGGTRIRLLQDYIDSPAWDGIVCVAPGRVRLSRLCRACLCSALEHERTAGGEGRFEHTTEGTSRNEPLELILNSEVGYLLPSSKRAVVIPTLRLPSSAASG